MGDTRNLRPNSERRRIRRSPVRREDTEISIPVGMRLFCQARTLEERGELERALDAYDLAAGCESVAADSLQACARIFREQGQLDDAIDALINALHHCEDDGLLTFELYVELGDVQAQLGDFEEATYFYRRAERYDHRDASLQRRLRSASALASSQALSVSVEPPIQLHPRADSVSVECEWEDGQAWDLEDWELATG